MGDARVQPSLWETGNPELCLGLGAYGHGKSHRRSLGPATAGPSSAHAEDHNACLCPWGPASMVAASWAMLVSPILKVGHHVNSKGTCHGEVGVLISA